MERPDNHLLRGPGRREEIVRRFLPMAAKFFRFVLVGVFNTVFFFFLFWVCHVVFKIDRWIAVTVAFILSTSAQYVGHSIFTFESKVLDRSQYLRFLVTILLGYVVTQAIMLYGPAFGLADTFLGVLVVVGLAAVNWFVFLLWVFRRRVV